MEKSLVGFAVLAVLAFGLLAGCASNPQATSESDPSQVEPAASYVHGEASVQYGHSAGN